jgi:ssDNA-specific exonuclease RecJ
LLLNKKDGKMKNEDNFKRAFDFLLKHAESEKPFKLEELVKASGWVKGTAKIYLSKKFNDLVKKKNGVYHVTPEIFRVRFDDFKDLYRQKQRLFTDYVMEAPQRYWYMSFSCPFRVKIACEKHWTTFSTRILLGKE